MKACHLLLSMLPKLKGNPLFKLFIRISSWQSSTFLLVKTLSVYYKNKVLVVLIMILKEKELKLIKIYMYICDVYESSLKFYYQKFSNNNHPFAKEYLLSWFLDLSSSYQAFNYRLILMPEAIRELVWLLIHSNLKIVAVWNH